MKINKKLRMLQDQGSISYHASSCFQQFDTQCSSYFKFKKVTKLGLVS